MCVVKFIFIPFLDLRFLFTLNEAENCYPKFTRAFHLRAWRFHQIFVGGTPKGLFTPQIPLGLWIWEMTIDLFVMKSNELREQATRHNGTEWLSPNNLGLMWYCGTTCNNQSAHILKYLYVFLMRVCFEVGIF
jgi:hypothetical protein